MNRIRLWIYRRTLRRVIERRYRSLLRRWAWWSDRGVKTRVVTPSPYEVLKNLIDGQFVEGSDDWRLQTEAMQLLWEISTLGGDSSFRAVTEDIKWRSHPSDPAQFV